MNIETIPNTPNNETWRWSVAKWQEEILQADTEGKLVFFNDVITGTHAPHEENGEHLVLSNVVIGGKTCDVYHWDQKNGESIQGATSCRVYVHIKD